jgi:hypothetical protein
MSNDYYADPHIESPSETLPPPSEHESANEAVREVQDEIFNTIANNPDDSTEDYVAERKDRDAVDRGETLSPEREAARLERYMRAMEAAGDFDQAVETHQSEAQHESDLAHRDSAVARNTRHEMRVEQFERQRPDYRQVVQGVFSAIPMGDHVAEALIESGRSAELAYAIANKIAEHPNPVAAMATINSMTPQELKIDLARIEGDLNAQERMARQPSQARRVTKAPPPMRQVRGGSASPSFDASTASMEEYAARRKSGWRG